MKKISEIIATGLEFSVRCKTLTERASVIRVLGRRGIHTIGSSYAIELMVQVEPANGKAERYASCAIPHETEHEEFEFADIDLEEKPKDELNPPLTC